MKHRVVITPVFWAALEAELPSYKEPNWHQFAAYDLNGSIRAFGNGWDDLLCPEPGLPDHRMHIGAGRIASWVATGRWSALRPEIELIGLSLQLWPPEAYEISSDA